MSGINGFNGYYGYYGYTAPQYNFKSANNAPNNAFPQMDVYTKPVKFSTQPQTTPEKNETGSDKYLKIGAAVVGLGLLAYGLYRGRNLLRGVGNKPVQPPHNPPAGPQAAETAAQTAARGTAQTTGHAAPALNQAAGQNAAQTANAVDNAAQTAQNLAQNAANKADDAVQIANKADEAAKAAKEAEIKAAKEAEARAAKEAEEKAAKEAEARAAKEAEEKAAREAAKKAAKEAQDKYAAQMDVVAKQKLQEINAEWAEKLDTYAGIKLMANRKGFQCLGKDMEKLENGTFRIKGKTTNGSHLEYYSADGSTLSEFAVFKDGKKSVEIGFRDKGKTGDLAKFNEKGEPELIIDFAVNGEKGKRLIKWFNSAKKFDEEGLSSIYRDLYAGKMQWYAVPPKEVCECSLSNWCKL